MNDILIIYLSFDWMNLLRLTYFSLPLAVARTLAKYDINSISITDLDDIEFNWLFMSLNWTHTVVVYSISSELYIFNI